VRGAECGVRDQAIGRQDSRFVSGDSGMGSG
jgi:hypothetical protein